MITTIDGVEKKPGSRCYYISYGGQSDNYYPQSFIVSPMDDEEDSEFHLFHDKKLCAEQCNLMNQDNKN